MIKTSYDTFADTVLMHAIATNDAAIVRDAMQQYPQGQLPPDEIFSKAIFFYVFDEKKNPDAVLALIACAPDASLWPQAYRQGMLAAIDHKCADVLKALLEKGADPVADHALVRLRLLAADMSGKDAPLETVIATHLQKTWGGTVEEARRKFAIYPHKDDAAYQAHLQNIEDTVLKDMRDSFLKDMRITADTATPPRPARKHPPQP